VDDSLGAEWIEITDIDLENSSPLVVEARRKEDYMTNSRKIAGLIGPSIIAITASEWLNLHIWAINMPTIAYLNGILLFIAGLSIVRAHNYWTTSWPVLVTLTGWITILGGLYRMFFPEAQQLAENISTYVFIIFLGVIGIFMTFKAYSREGGKKADKK